MSLNLETLSILIVEDAAPMQRLLFSLIESLGFKKIYSAPDGVQGYEMFRRHNPDIVLTDWMMEPGDGLDLTRLIRTHAASPNKMAPVVLITGYSSLARVHEARDAGVTEFLVKPFTAADIAKRMSHIINHPRDFVALPEFFGPDRRRRKSDDYKGPKRRDGEKPATTARTGLKAASWDIDFD
jgi:CheY-like chemotaxis protein